MLMIYRRSPLANFPFCFTYAVHFPGQNFVQFGVGYESANTLQRKHCATENVHHFHVLEHVELIERAMPVLKVDALRDHFGFGQIRLEPEEVRNLVADIRAVYAEAYDDPRDGRARRVDLGTGIFAYVRYHKVRDHDVETMQVGLGAIDQGIAQYGEPNVYLFDDTARQWACQMFPKDARRVVLSKAPPNCRCTAVHLGPEARQALAAEIVRMADKLWPQVYRPNS